MVCEEVVATNPLVRHDPTVSCQLTSNSKKARHPQVTQVNVLEHIIHRITKSQPTIDGSRIGIRSDDRAPFDTFETLVITLSGGKDGPQRIAQRIEWDDVRGRDGRHVGEGRREEWVLVRD